MSFFTTMSQLDVEEALKDETEWMTTAEIYEKLKDKVNRSSVVESLRRLTKNKYVERVRCMELKHAYKYKLKR
jgi:Fe2+ or Zn2+ uptake regulation protein